MLFRALVAVAAVITVLGLLLGSAILVIIGVPVLFYLGSLVVAPKRKCASCHGAKYHDDVFGSSAVRKCWTCGGHGQYARWGTVVLRPGVHGQIRAGKHGKNY